MARSTERRGPYAKTAATRETIIQAALEYFRLYGYHGASMREIARHVGLSQAGLLHHFRTKGELLFAALSARDTLTGSVARSTTEDPLERMVAIMADNAGRKELVRMFSVLSGEATEPTHPGHDYFATRQARVLDWFTAHFEAAVEQGQAPADLDCEVAARLCQAEMYGLQVQWLLDPSTDMVGLFRTFVESVVRANAGNEGTPRPPVEGSGRARRPLRQPPVQVR